MNSRLTDGELAKIIQRDAMAGATWFTGPPSFTALAAQDRRALIDDLCALRAEAVAGQPARAEPAPLQRYYTLGWELHQLASMCQQHCRPVYLAEDVEALLKERATATKSGDAP